MNTKKISLKDIYELVHKTMISNGCNEANACALADIITMAERDGSHSHGLFRVPGYVKALRSGKVDGKAQPEITNKTPAIIQVNGNRSFAPLAQKIGLPVLEKVTKELGIGALSLVNIHHFAALWPETEFLANRGLVGFACTAYMPSVAPSGSKEKLFGTNPISFAWPRPTKTPVCFDMATSSMALGDLQIAARDGRAVPHGTGLDSEGNVTTDPAKILSGVLLPFGGYKGSAIALMVELLSAGLTGEQFSYEAKENDNGDGGPPRGGEMIIAISPELIAGKGWQKHVEHFMERLKGLDGVRVPGERRHKNRKRQGPRLINANLLETIEKLL